MLKSFVKSLPLPVFRKNLLFQDILNLKTPIEPSPDVEGFLFLALFRTIKNLFIILIT